MELATIQANPYYKLGRCESLIERFEDLRDDHPELYLEWHGTTANEQLALLRKLREELLERIATATSASFLPPVG